MIVAFDFDGVLDNVRIQALVRKFKNKNCQVWVITARKDNEFNRGILKPIIDKLFISFSNVVFCNEKSKIEVLQTINADLYIDNENLELNDINKNTDTIGLLF